MSSISTNAPAHPPNLSSALPPLPTPRKIPSRPTESPIPAPETPPLPAPPSLTQWTYIKPTRRILSPQDHELFKASPTYSLLTSFVFSLSDSVHNVPISAVSPTDLHPTVAAIISILDDTEAILATHPAEDTGSRFGNPAFRTFLDAVDARLASWHTRDLGIQSSAAIEETSTYLASSFGNQTRIDYGSGHELNFILWLLCLYQLSLLPRTTFPSLVLVVFPRYLRLMRSVQMTYYLEPAGSHGVWGLDDYQFLPFLFGASQLLNHRYIRPKSIHSSLVLEECAKDYLYLDQVAFVNSVKNVEGLRWHSPMLDDISAAKNWGKIEAGMRKMFVAEVLGKLPVMQHFLFGSLVPAAEGMSREEEIVMAEAEGEVDGEQELVVIKDGMRHVHTPSSWGDCCGIKVPSSVGAAQEMKKRMGVEGLRRVPFD